MSAAQDEYDELMRDKERRSAHPEDDDRAEGHASSDDDDDEERNAPRTNGYANHDGDDNHDADDDDDQTTFSRPSISLARHTIPRTRYQANTGPKGVISDAQDFRDSHRVHVRHSQQLSRETQARGTGALGELAPPPPSMRGNGLDEDEGEDGVDDDADGDDDEEFMRRWRDRRLEQLVHGRGLGGAMQERPPPRERRLWGALRTVDGEGYLDAVEQSPAGTVVVVYIYDDEMRGSCCVLISDSQSDVSVELEDCVRGLARQHPATRFVRLHFLDAEMEPAGVPALLAYRDGDKFAGLVPLVQELPDDADVSATTLEVLLKKYVLIVSLRTIG
nr:phosducin-like protein [Quercus suber]